MIERGPLSIVGGGPTGALLAILLARNGWQVTIFEARPDPRRGMDESGRTINLALADRGIHALKAAGVYDRIAGAWVPMRGRLIHGEDGSQSFQAYGRRPGEMIFSVSRHCLNQVLLQAAEEEHAVDIKFEHRLENIDFDSGMAFLRDLGSQRILPIPMHPLLATDGAGSMTRRRMAASGLIKTNEADLAHGYKELTIPAVQGGYAMKHDALHIWPRGNFMLIALPNADCTFTATLFLPKHGAVSFAALQSSANIEGFLRTQFADVYPLMPGCVAEFEAHPVGFLGTVYADKWNTRGMTALIGDAAHAIVPFHGQGMNCCLEDCLELEACLRSAPTWQSAFEDFFARRKPNTDAIAAMALENYSEMRERVVDPKFRLQQNLALELERRHPQRFIPRYSMVMFHHEIPYATAEQRGLIQSQLLDDLTCSATTLRDVDYERADREINRRLPPIHRPHAPT